MKTGIVELNRDEIDGVSGAPLGLIIKGVKWLLTSRKATAVAVASEAGPSTPQ